MSGPMRRKADRLFKQEAVFGGFTKCRYCGTTLFRSDVTVDHVKPKAAGGTNANSNLALCCVLCNRMKGTRHAVAFEAWLQSERGRRWLATRGRYR